MTPDMGKATRTIRVDPEVYAVIRDAQVEIATQERRVVSMSEATRRAINRAQQREAIHEHAVFVDHRFGAACGYGIAHRGCCSGSACRRDEH